MALPSPHPSAAASPLLRPDLLGRSQQSLRETFASHALAEQSFETPLGEIATRAPVTCSPDTPLREALSEMQRRKVGSMLVTDAGGAPVGILTRHDVLGRIALPEVPLSAPIRQVMMQPVHSLTVAHTAQDATLLMSRHGIAHVPVTRGGLVVGMVSGRDLFALQRMGLRQVSASIRSARDVEALRLGAADIRRLARNLLGQGVQARQLTALVSQLNDLLTSRLLEMKAAEHGVDLGRVCWLALGSEGRGEQTVATDQDNALILPDDATEAERRQALAFGHDVNLALDACGYPLCRGGIMAGEPGCCRTLQEWRERFGHWIEHGAPQDLLDASIYFDLRPLAGDEKLATVLRTEVLAAAQATPRFLKQMALNALARGAPLNWLGGLRLDARGTVDLKLQGTALFVDAGRLYSLALGTGATGTRERLETAGQRMGLDAAEYQAWATAFEFLQMLRLRIQLEGTAPITEPNRIKITSLNHVDRLVLKECLGVARMLQRRLQMDYQR